MAKSSQDAENTLSSPIPFDPTTLQQRIQREIVGISALSEFLAALGPQVAVSAPAGDTAAKDTDAGSSSFKQISSPQPRTEMIRIRLDDEFWVDMTPDQVDGFLRRKEASLRAVEERRGNLAQLQEWMIRELQDMTSHTSETILDDPEGDITEISREQEVTGSNASASVETQLLEDVAQNAAGQSTIEESQSTDIVHSSAIPAIEVTAGQSAPTQETMQRLEDINSALAKLGTSMQEVLKLDPQAAADGAGASNGVEVGGDGTVLNEEGLPFHDIREDLPQPLDTQDVTPAVAVETTTSAPPTAPPVDDYWSQEAIDRRRRLREKLFGGDDDDDDEEEEEEQDGEDDGSKDDSPAREEEDVTVKPDAKRTLSPPSQQPRAQGISQTPSVIPLPEPETASQPKGKGKAVPRKQGFMARSLVIDHSQEEKASQDEDEDQSSPQTGLVYTPNDIDAAVVPDPVKSAIVAPTTVPPPSLKTSETEGITPGERRKSVTFNPQTRVRLYEKGEVMPNVSSGPSAVGASDSGSRFELLPDNQDAKGVQETTAVPPVAINKPTTSAVSTKSKGGGAFSGFKRGFLDNGSSKKQTGHATQPTTVATPLLSTSASTTQAKANVASTSQPTIVESPEYHQPLAPAHEKPTRTKKQSLFAQRKAEAQNKREQLMNFSSFDPMSNEPVGTGAPASTGAKAPLPHPMKLAVVEKPVAVAKPPAQPKPISGPIPTAPSPQQFPPTVKKSRESPALPEADPGPVKRGKQTAVQETVMERKPAAASAGAETAAKLSAATDSAEPNDSDSDSLADFEYSDGEDAFDMDEALLAREAALAYHAKRSALGRKGLGGWTGAIGPDGEVEWDTEIVPMSAGMEEAPPRTGPVAFGERIIPQGLEDFRLPTGADGDKDSSDDEQASDGFASISVPQVIPASENLASSIKIGKLENGNLVVQDTDDSDEEIEAEVAQADDVLTTEERSAREQAAEERRQRKAMIDRLRKGDVAEMIREEREREELFRQNGGGYVEPPLQEPPALVNSATSASSRTLSASSPVSEKPRRNGGNIASQKDIVPSTGIIPVVTPQVDTQQSKEEVQPKKVSRFKAARMAASS